MLILEMVIYKLILDHAAPVSNQSVELSTQSNVIDSQGHDLLPVKRKPGRPRKIPLPPGYVPPQPVQRRPKKLPKVYSSDSSSKSNKSKKAHKHSKRRDSYASESGSTSTPQDLDAVYLPGRKRPINPSAINLQDRSGRTLIFKYSARGDVETTTSLLKAGAVLHIADYAGWTPLHEACLNGHAEIVDLMLIHGADVNARGGDGDTPLHDAVGNGHLEVVKILLRYGASFECTNESGQTALEFAQEVHHSTLKEKDITPDQIENASSIILVLKDWARMTKKIVKRDDEGQTLLHHAAIKGSIDRISNLLWYGCDINAQDNAGVTPLHDGCLHGNADVVEKLLAFGANMDILNHEGQSCMHDAIANNHYECVKVLLKYGFKNSQSVVPKAHYRFECKILLEKPADFWKPNSIPEYHPRVIDTSKPIEAHKSKPKLPEDPTVPYPFAWGGLDKKKPGAFESTREEKKFHAFLKSLEKNEEKKAPSSLMMRLDIDTEGSNLSTDMTNIKIKRSYNRKNVDSSERYILM
jgi:ankyrin repeat protein